MELNDHVRYYQNYFREVAPQEWNLEEFEIHYLAKAPPDFMGKDDASKFAHIKGHYLFNLRFISEKEPPFTDVGDESQARASELLELHRREKNDRKKRKRDCFIANQKPELERPAKRIDGNVDVPNALYNVNVGQINVNAPVTRGNLDFLNIVPEVHAPSVEIFPHTNANVGIDRVARLEPLPSTPVHRALLEGLPGSPGALQLELLDDIQGSRESSLPPTVVLSPPDTTPAIGKVVIPSYVLTMPFDLHYKLIQDERKVSLRSGETLEELMLDLYQTNHQHSPLRQFIDWGLIYLSDTTVTEHLTTTRVKELLALARKAPESGPNWKRMVEPYHNVYNLPKEIQSKEPLESWYYAAVTAFKEYPASILSHTDWWRHERFYSFLDNLFSISARINRRRTTLTQVPSKRDPTHCNIYEYFDRDCGLQLAYLEHQLHATNTEHVDIFYLSRVLLGGYRDWLNDDLSRELVVFAVICSGPKISVYRFCPVSDHFAVVTAYTSVITLETLPKVLEMLYRVKLAMDRSIEIFDEHLAAEDPF